MTCAADGFGLNSVRRSNRQSSETNPGFERNRNLHNVFFQMCGSKQKFSQLTIDKLSDRRNAGTASKAKFDLKIAVAKDEIKKNTQFSVKTRENETLLPSGQAALPHKSKHEPIHKKTSPVPTCLDLMSSSSRWPVSCTIKLPAEIHHPVSLGESQEIGLMFTQSGNLKSGQKRSSTDGDADVSDRKRRNSEDNNKQPESMDVTFQKLSAPFCNYENPREVTHHSYNNPFREVTSPVFSPFLLTDTLTPSNNVCLSAVQRYRTSNRKQRKEDILEYTCFDSEIISRNIEVFHNAVQQLLVKCISLQKKRYSVYIPSWKDTTIRIYDTYCGRYRTDNQNKTPCSAAGRSCQTDKHQPTHNGVSYQSLKQLQNDATVRNVRSQHKIRSQIQAMRQHWLGLPKKCQHRLEVSRRFILVLDKHLRVIFVSENVSRHLGYQQDDMLGGSIGQFIHPKQMSYMSKLTRGRRFQTDDKHGVPLWKTGKVITVAMRVCLQNTRTGLQDTGYKPVLWNVNLRLKKREHCTRAQDMVVLCRPLHDCTVTSLQMGRKMLISPCNPSFNFHFCNFSYDVSEKTMHHKEKNLNGIQHLCFDTESNLLNVNHSEFNYLKNISHSYLRGPDCDLSSTQFLQSCAVNGHVCSSGLPPQWWTNMDETSDNNYHSSVVNSYASLTLQPSKCVCTNKSKRRLCNNISACVRSDGAGRMCHLSTTCTNNFMMTSPGIHHKDVNMHVGIKLFANRYGKSLSQNLQLNQKCFVPSKLPSTNIYCLNQTSSFTDNIRPGLFRKASVDHKNIPTDELKSDEADISDDSKSPYEDITDVEISELATESEPESPSKTSIHKNFSFDCTHNPTQILTGNKHPDQLLSACLQLPLDFKTESNLKLFSCQCHIDAKSSCSLPGNTTPENFCKTDSSTLSSILQMENISPVLVRKKINEDVLMQTCPTVGSFDSTASANHTVRKRTNTLLHNFLLDLASTPAYDSTTLCNSMSPTKNTSQSKSSNVHRQVSSASNTLCSLACSRSPVTNHMSSASTAASAYDNDSVNSTHAREKSTCNSINTLLLTESAVEQAENVNKVHSVSSKMTYQKYDPFLSQASFSDFNSFPNTDMFDDLSSVTCPVTSQIEQDTQSHLKDQFSSSNFQTFLDPAPESTSFASESLSDLDSLLNTIPMNHVTNAQTTLFPVWPESDTSQSSDSMSLSNYFLNKDTISKPSLLRKLLDKEGSAFQEPDGDTAWILDQIPEKNSDLKKPRIHCGSKNIRYSVGKQAKYNKNLIRSVEIPKAELNPRQMMQFNKYKPQYQKPTKELPLPSSIKAAGTSPSHELLQQDAVPNGLASPENSLEKELRKRIEFRSSDHSTNCELPDDLIDMAVECCTPLEMDQTEALISDLHDSCSWEDNLYSLLESSGQDNSGNNSDSESPHQTSEKLVTSKHPKVTSELLSSFFHSKDSFSIPSTASSTTAESGFLHHTQPNKETLKSSTCQTSLPHQQKMMSHQVNKTSSCGSSVPSLSTPNCTNTAGKMSLLRAAITSDVDKLIEQIPLRHARKPACTVHRTYEREDDDPDILITKVMGLSSLHKHHHKVNKVKPASKAGPSENISRYKALQSSKTTMTASRNVMSPPSVQTFTTSVPRKSCDKWQLLQNSPSCEHCGNASKIPPIMNPLVIKISIGSSSTPTVICSNRGSQNNLSQHIKPDSQNKVFDKSPNPSFPRAQKSSSSDLSSTQPVSVMIMRKENHRSRRSKSIAIQTDNEPGEVYPEFEHNPSDTILYPSTIITYPSSASSPQDTSPLSTRLSSRSSSLSETDKFLPSHPSPDDSSSSADDDYRTISSTPFLFKLLKGELSKDHYQRLDQQMMDKERKKSSLQ